MPYNEMSIGLKLRKEEKKSSKSCVEDGTRHLEDQEDSSSQSSQPVQVISVLHRDDGQSQASEFSLNSNSEAIERDEFKASNLFSLSSSLVKQAGLQKVRTKDLNLPDANIEPDSACSSTQAAGQIEQSK